MVHFVDLKINLKIYFRIIPVILISILLVIFGSKLQDENFQTRHYLYPFLFTPTYMTNVNGMAVTFTMNLARKIGTYETSIEPFEDCCTIFLPKNPVIHPKLEKVREAEKAGVKYAVALAACTPALHLCVKLAGEKLYGKPAISHGALEGKRVFCSDITFDATLNPVVYEGGIPVFIVT